MILKRNNEQIRRLNIEKEHLTFGVHFVHTPRTPSGTPLTFWASSLSFSTKLFLEGTEKLRKYIFSLICYNAFLIRVLCSCIKLQQQESVDGMACSMCLMSVWFHSKNLHLQPLTAKIEQYLFSLKTAAVFSMIISRQQRLI